MTTDVDLSTRRAEFPVLEQTMHGRSLVYFDNAATSLKPRPVMDAITRYYTQFSANIHRGVYEMSQQATSEYDAARESLKRLIGCDSDGETIFTRGATESVNLVALAWAARRLGPGDEIALSPMEHHSNLVPWQAVAERTGARLAWFELAPDGTLADGTIERTIGDRTRLVALTAMSNVTGYCPPLEEVIETAHAVGARVLVDGAQYVSHHPVDVATLGCDFLVFSGHKMCGPTGIGVLYARREILEEMEPFHYGGDMIQEVRLDGSSWAHLPEKFEAGTPNIAGAIGMGAAAEYLMSIGLDTIAAHERMLYSHMARSLVDTGAIETYGADPDINRGGIFSFNVPRAHPNDVGTLLDQQGIAVRTGFHCAQPLMRHFGITGTVRASFYLYNTVEEVDHFVDAVGRARAILG